MSKKAARNRHYSMTVPTFCIIMFHTPVPIIVRLSRHVFGDVEGSQQGDVIAHRVLARAWHAMPP